MRRVGLDTPITTREFHKCCPVNSGTVLVDDIHARWSFAFDFLDTGCNIRGLSDVSLVYIEIMKYQNKYELSVLESNVRFIKEEEHKHML